MIKFKALLAVSALALVVVSFQNCGSGFEAIKSESLGGFSDGTPANGTPPEPPAASTTPNLVPQMAPAGLPMNVTTRVPLPVQDTDTDSSLMNFVVVTPPMSGRVAVDATGVSTDRGFTYTPNIGFLGEDTMTIYAIDPQGNRSPNLTYRINVQARDIGQLLGSFAKSTCTPTTSPIVASYSSTLNTFQFRETIFAADCATPLLEHVISGAHAVGAENVPTLSGLTGFEYNVTNHSSSVRPLSAAAAQA